jgi:citrate lyase beta subunit
MIERLFVSATGLPRFIAASAGEFVIVRMWASLVAASLAYDEMHGDLTACLDAAVTAALTVAEGFEGLFLLHPEFVEPIHQSSPQ